MKLISEEPTMHLRLETRGDGHDDNPFESTLQQKWILRYMYEADKPRHLGDLHHGDLKGEYMGEWIRIVEEWRPIPEVRRSLARRPKKTT